MKVSSRSNAHKTIYSNGFCMHTYRLLSHLTSLFHQETKYELHYDELASYRDASGPVDGAPPDL